jgi:hypothetical protein
MGRTAFVLLLLAAAGCGGGGGGYGSGTTGTVQQTKAESHEAVSDEIAAGVG